MFHRETDSESLSEMDCDVFGVLHAGDIFFSKDTISTIVKRFKEIIDVIYGDQEIN